MKWIGLYATFVHIKAKLGEENILRMVRWHCPPDTGFEIQTLEVWGQARYLSVTEARHNTEFYEWMGKKYFCFFQTAETGVKSGSILPSQIIPEKIVGAPESTPG